MPSRTPTELNENWGTNYGLDGYLDMEYGKGLKERGLQEPDFSGLPGTLSSDTHVGLTLDSEVLGVNPESPLDGDFELGGDLPLITASLSPTRDSVIVDHSWLENAFQDPARLPHFNGNQVQEGLEKLWGTRNTGINRVDLKDRDALLSERLSHSADDDPFNIDKISRDKNISSVISSAMRKSASSVPLNIIAKEMYEGSGHDVQRIKKAFQAIKREHGLVGNVYIRSSAFPKWETGKWSKEISRFKTARFIISPRTPEALKMASNLGLTVVESPEEIPWKKEAKIYEPFLRDSGRVLDQSLSPSERIRKAFLEPGKSPAFQSPLKPEGERFKKLSKKILSKSLEEFTPLKREVKSSSQIAEEKSNKIALQKFGKWVKARLISPEEFEAIKGSKTTPSKLLDKVASLISSRSVRKGNYEGDIYRDEGLGNPVISVPVLPKNSKKALEERRSLFEKLLSMSRSGLISENQVEALRNLEGPPSEVLKLASKLAQTSKKGKYSGVENEGPKVKKVSKKKISKNLQEAGEVSKKKQAKVQKISDEKLLKEKVAFLSNSIKSGVHGKKLATLIQGMISPEEGERVKHLLNPLLLKYNSFGTNSKKANEYQSSTYTEFRGSPTLPKMNVTTKDISNVVKLASTQMNLGMAGAKLDSILSSNVSPEILKEASPQLFNIRKKHEGLAGFAYIDPKAYDTEGVKGCTKGASIHKHNKNIPYLLGMKKCATCVHNVGNQCGKYAKRIISKVPHDNVEELKNANIQKSSFSVINDEEFFADNGGYIDEYGLEAPPEEGFTFSLNPEPSSEEDKMELAFGGMSVEF